MSVTWTITDYDFAGNVGQSGNTLAAANGYAPLGGGVVLSWGSISGVAADGSAESTFTYPWTSYGTSIYSIKATIYNGASVGQYALSLQLDNATLTTVKVYVAGGPAGSLVQVYLAVLGL